MKKTDSNKRKTSDFTENNPNLEEVVPNLTEKLTSLSEKVPNFTEKLTSLGEKVPNLTEKITSLGEKVPNLTDKLPNFSELMPNLEDMMPNLNGLKVPHLNDIGIKRNSPTYSAMNLIPQGRASGKLIPGCLVLEGGAFRGLYTQGFLDAMMLHGINLSCVIGVSAGALGGSSYVSGQIGRSARINLTYRHDQRFVGMKALLHSHSILDVGFLTEDRDIFEPLDLERFMNPEQRFIAVVTDCETGKPVYCEKGKCSDIMTAIRASGTMPFISPMVEMDGRFYLDGGCSCKIPYQWALDQDFEKIVVIKTKEVGFRRSDKPNESAYRFYGKNPQFAESLAHSNMNWNRQCDEIEKLHEEGRIFRVAPSQPVKVGRIEGDLEKLGELYWLGFHDCEELLPQLVSYLGMEMSEEEQTRKLIPAQVDPKRKNPEDGRGMEAVETEHRIRNPIIPGFFPDPSICRVKDDFYLCCSSFEMYPGLPLWHSKDLANWERIGYALTRENGFHVDANSWAGGVMAPTLRYHNGVFYIINCNFADRGNFIITAQDPAGPWSEPHWLEDVPGIDASLFFDDDGSCYVMGTGEICRPDGTKVQGIWAALYDIDHYKMVGEPVGIWDSALRHAASPEAPHLYHIGDFYYLMIAEGGTEHFHAVTMARSRSVLGWYEGCPANPVLTHRNQGFSARIANVGHADLVETPQGNWYAVMLGSRTVEGYYKNFGRETFICPVEWQQDGWPVFSPETGRVEFDYPADPALPWTPYAEAPSLDHFDEDEYPGHLIWWGTPYDDFYHISDSCLFLRCLPHPLAFPVRPFGYEKSCGDNVAVVGRTQRDVNFDLETRLRFTPQGDEEAGLVILQQSAHQYQLVKANKDGNSVIRLIRYGSVSEGRPWMSGYQCTLQKEILEEEPYEYDEVVLSVKVRGQDYTFSFGKDHESMTILEHHGDGRLLNPPEVGPMAGTYLAMAATSNEVESSNEAAFDYFLYQPVES